MAISEVLQQHMLRVIKELPSSTSKVATGQAKEPLLLKAFWDALPEEFEAKDFKATAQEVACLFQPPNDTSGNGWTPALTKSLEDDTESGNSRRSPGDEPGLFYNVVHID